MYSYNQVINGIAKYMDTEIISNISGWQKWREGWIAGCKRGQENVRYDGITIKQLLGEFSQVITMILSSSGFRKKEEQKQ